MCGARAQDLDHEQVVKNAFIAALPTIIENYNDERQCQMYAYWYELTDVDGDNTPELALADYDLQYYSIFKYSNGEVKQIPVQPLNDENWRPVFYMVNDLKNLVYDNDPDITLRHRPIFAHDININANKFTASSDVWGYVNPDKFGIYDCMFFKPHIGTVKLVRANETPHNVQLTWSLTDATFTRKMFRGYASTQATPIVVPHAYLDTHNPLQFSRWLQGEEIRHPSPDIKTLISNVYGGRAIHDAQWVASCELGGRDYYNVVFEPEDGFILYAFVCVGEGEVQSVKNEWFEVEQDSKTIVETGETLDDIFFHGPQIMAIVGTPVGLELYVRWNSMEGIHYSIWREMGNEWITILDDYQYLIAF